MLHPYDLIDVADVVLDVLWHDAPALRPVVTAARALRAARTAFWNDPVALRRQVQRDGDRRWRVGYTASELARGIDDVESDQWELMRARIVQIGRRRRITVAQTRPVRCQHH